jgi:dipeptidyl aminopeptidase/acylaminoacyl peptidase
MAPNVRGSTGYGEAFTFANRFDWGGGDLSDVRQGAVELARTGFVDARKIAIVGGSYGGYMTLMALTKQPEAWAAGVSMVPIANLFTEFEREDPQLREYDRFFMGDPEKNKALWMDRSPVNFVDRIRAPLLLFAGGNDPRDPPAETTQIAEAIAKRGGIVEAKIYPDEGHAFSRRENRVDELERSVMFLEKHVQKR